MKCINEIWWNKMYEWNVMKWNVWMKCDEMTCINEISWNEMKWLVRWCHENKWTMMKKIICDERWLWCKINKQGRMKREWKWKWIMIKMWKWNEKMD